jgi:hypothetical protein
MAGNWIILAGSRVLAPTPNGPIQRPVLPSNILL